MTIQLFRSKRVVLPDGVRPAGVLVKGGRIEAVLAPNARPKDAVLHDFDNMALLPGLVDSHTHINEPGRTDWEGFSTATRAAAAGGYTMLVDMPLNCLPATTTVEALEAKREAAQDKCVVDWAPWGGVESGNQLDIEPLAAAGVPGFKCFLAQPGIDGFTMVTEAELRRALPHVAKTGLPLLVHAELPAPLEAAAAHLTNANWNSYATYLESRPDEAELEAIRLLIDLCREFRFRLHIVHLATSQAVWMLCEARAGGLPVTIETCPHYLYFSAEKIPNGATLCKCAPPIRGEKNREDLWQALRKGVIDLIATDHSPCPPAMKRLDEGNFQTAWGGIASLSMALPVVWTQASARGFSLNDVVRWMGNGPARLAGCAAHKGAIEPGHDADFVVFDPESEFVVTKERLCQRHPISPYMGERLRGVVRQTYLRGGLIFDQGTFPAKPNGQEYRG